MTLRSALLVSTLLLLGSRLQAQEFIRKAPDQPLTFKEMQRQFAAWAQGRDLSKEKYWKYFKRWEMDMQLHTNSTGEPADPALYINAAVAAAEEKEQLAAARLAAAPWYPVGPNALPANQTGYMENGIGRINCIAFHPTSTSTYFVGVAQGGVWKTTNNGQSWTPLTDNLPITRISDIAIDPNNPNTMYISVCDFEYIGAGLRLDARKRNTHYGLGVYKTTNGGATWTATGLSFQLTNGDASLIRKIIVNPANSSQLVACGVSGMYTSNNGGTTWTKKVNQLFWDMVQHPTTPGTLYAASGWVKNANTGRAGIYRSTDFGANWTQLSTGIPPTGSVQRLKLAIAPSDPNYIYALAVNTTSGMYGLYKTTNGGTSWQFINPGVNVLDAFEGSSSSGQGTYDLALMVNKTNKNLIYTGGVNIWGSADGGQTFNPISHWTTQYGPTLHGDIHFIEQQPVTGNVFVCNDGGLYRTASLRLSSWNDANNGIPWPTVWTNISNGMATTSFYRLSSSRNSTGRLVAGAQDNATFYFDGSAWSTIFGGDGMDNYLDPLDDFTVIGSSQYGNFYLSTDGGLSAVGIDPNFNNEAAEWTSPIVADYSQPGTLYAGFQNVSKSTDGGNTWSSLASFPGAFRPNEITCLAVGGPNTLYAAKRVRYENSIPGSVYKTTNGGTSWTNITAGLPDSLYYTSLEANPTQPNTAYITMAGFSSGRKVYRTTNGGTSWQNISYNLPNIPVNCVKVIPNTNNLIIATDIGVYTLAQGATTWTNQSVGLPNVIVSDIEFNPAARKMYVSTFGRGIWATDLSTFVVGTEEEAPAAAGSITLYPSPNNGSFTLQLGQAAAQANQLEVVDITGRVVYKQALSGSTEQQLRLDVPAGLYFARISGKGLAEVRRFVVN